MIKSNLINFLYLSILIIIIILNFTYYLHPITTISLILLYSSFACIIITLKSFNYIYSIIIFLIIIRGILILFIYFARLISNEQHKIHLNLIITLKTIITLILIYKINYFYQSPHWSQDHLTIIKLKACPFLSLFKLYDYPYNYLTLICIFFLLISIFLIIKIRSIKSSSLRKII